MWNPPANRVKPLAEVWNHVETTYADLYGFKNYGWDQLMATKGTLNYCVRGDSDAPVTATTRDRIHAGAPDAVQQLTSSPSLKEGDSNPYGLRFTGARTACGRCHPSGTG